jgi:hypothetical protein
VTPKVEVEFERKFGLGIGKAFMEQKREHQHYLAWLAVKASGAVVKPFDGWLETFRTLRCWWSRTLFDRQSLTWTVAAVAVETGIAPSELLVILGCCAPSSRT